MNTRKNMVNLIKNVASLTLFLRRLECNICPQETRIKKEKDLCSIKLPLIKIGLKILEKTTLDVHCLNSIYIYYILIYTNNSI